MWENVVFNQKPYFFGTNSIYFVANFLKLIEKITIDGCGEKII